VDGGGAGRSRSALRTTATRTRTACSSASRTTPRVRAVPPGYITARCDVGVSLAALAGLPATFRSRRRSRRVSRRLGARRASARGSRVWRRARSHWNGAGLRRGHRRPLCNGCRPVRARALLAARCGNAVAMSVCAPVQDLRLGGVSSAAAAGWLAERSRRRKGWQPSFGRSSPTSRDHGLSPGTTGQGQAPCSSTSRPDRGS
jgi:hypothetical protein